MVTNDMRGAIAGVLDAATTAYQFEYVFICKFVKAKHDINKMSTKKPEMSAACEVSWVRGLWGAPQEKGWKLKAMMPFQRVFLIFGWCTLT